MVPHFVLFVFVALVGSIDAKAATTFATSSNSTILGNISSNSAILGNSSKSNNSNSINGTPGLLRCHGNQTITWSVDPLDLLAFKWDVVDLATCGYVTK